MQYLMDDTDYYLYVQRTYYIRRSGGLQMFRFQVQL